MVNVASPGRATRRARRVVSVAAFGLVAVVLVALGVLAAAVWLPGLMPVSVSPTVSPSTVAVSGQVYDGAHQVGYSVTGAESLSVRAAASGVVTKSTCTAGATLASGDALWWVDSEPVLGLATKEPLWRDLTAGDEGRDVSVLQDELTRLGYAVDTTGVYDWATRQAVRAMRDKAGDDTDTTDLPVASVLWMPSPKMTLSSCTVTVNDVLSPGAEVAQVAGGLTGLLLANPPGDGWVATYGTAKAVVEAGGRITDPGFLAAVQAGPEYQFYTSTGQASALTVTVALAKPKNVLVVPPGAVVVSGPGQGCLVADGRTVPVSIVSSSLGQTLVEVTAGTVPAEVTLRPDPATTCA